MESNIIIPYSQHHRDCAMMIGKPGTQAVFEYLFDEYQARMRAGKPIAEIPFSKSKISKARSIDRKTIDRILASLEEMTLVTVSENYYSLNGKLYMALIKAFSVLPYNDRARFTELLSQGKIEGLEAFGVSLDNVSEKEILEMSGSFDKVAENSTGMVKNPQVCGNFHNIEEKSTSMRKNQQWCGIFRKFESYYEEFSTEIRKKMWNFPQVCGFLNTIGDGELPESDIKKLATAIVAEKSPIDDEEMQIFLLLGCGNFRRGVWKNPQLGGEISPTEINNKINKKEKVEERSSSPKKKEQDSFSEQDELDFNIPANIEEDDDEPLDFQVDVNMMGSSLNKYQLYKKQQKLPFFPASSIKDFTSDIRNCLDRADKLFISQVWTILHELFDTEEQKDDDGNVMIPESDEVEQSAIIKERLEKDILFPALDATKELLEAGTVEVNGEELEITAQPIPDDYYGLIIEWETKTMLEGECYIVSASRIHDIYAEQVQDDPANVKTQRGNEAGREDDYSYMKKIIQIGNDDEKYKQLTPIELAAYNFLAEYFQFDDNGEIQDPSTNFLPERAFRVFVADIKQNGSEITKEDIVSVIFNNRLDEGGISLRNRMFSAQKIRNWNARHSLQSIVDDYELETHE